jgi:hypothetical protein
MANKHMKGRSTSFAITKLQIKLRMKYCSTISKQKIPTLNAGVGVE